MSPDPNPLKVPSCVANENENIEFKADCEKNAATSQTSEIAVRKSLVINNISMINIDGQKCKEAMNNMSIQTYRERRNVSPTSCVLNECFLDPQSPSSSSSTSQTTSANDTTFEPTIEMMVNDFDDEQTLNEEEALACLESQDPDEEIDTLKKESEMPLEELLAKYRALPPNIYSEPLRKKSSSHRLKQKQEINSMQTTGKDSDDNVATFIAVENSKLAKASPENFEEEIDVQRRFADDVKPCDFNEKATLKSVQTRESQPSNNLITPSEIPKVHRSHLLDLYPEGTFDTVVVGNETTAGNSEEIFYGVEDDEEDEEIEEDDEDYKKKVMIGTSYQATIPIGLSQYGDILPYENEDKLIWEPSQVSEREVEEYLIKIRDMKSYQQTEIDENAVEISSDVQLKENFRSEKNIDNLENNSLLANSESLTEEMSTATTTEMENQAVVKDNEQALHLLVQCGYDFKEALRRKRLNALPLNDCMSLWSEEECHKFEEGIQKYGKDFLRIRQNQVRTRTMRELVQFYYLWKKSERRDHNFANADTVDHMDIYLNEDNDYGSNPSAVGTPLSSPVGNNSNATAVGKNLNTSQKNISIMTTNATALAVTNSTSEKNVSNICLQQHLQQTQHHKRRAHSSNQSSLNPATSNLNSDSSSNSLANSSK